MTVVKPKPVWYSYTNNHKKIYLSDKQAEEWLKLGKQIFMKVKKYELHRRQK